MSLLAGFPSPSSGTVDIGGAVHIHMYGLMLLLGIAACIWLAGVRWVRMGGDWDLVFRVAVWGVAAGVVGARLYHVVTSWSEIPDEWWGVFAVWKGGLGVWGGILFGFLAGAWIVRRSGNRVALFADAVGPALLLAQGIGRWGNWFNQELFGKPTGLPWGLEISVAHCPGDYVRNGACVAQFHPTFLYEFLFDLVGVVLLLLIERRFRVRPPSLFAGYVAYYCLGRMLEEQLRIDPSGHFLGQRTNFWVSLVLFVGSVAYIWRNQRSGRHDLSRTVGGHERAVPQGPTMAVPRGRVRSRR